MVKNTFLCFLKLLLAFRLEKVRKGLTCFIVEQHILSGRKKYSRDKTIAAFFKQNQIRDKNNLQQSIS